MGGHGGLNILPQKRWNVYNFDNREKVRKDEEAAAREEQIKQAESRRRDFELRLQKLRHSNHPSNPNPSPSKNLDSNHINLFFKEEEEVEGGENKDKKRKRGEKEKEKEKEKVVITAEDMKYKLGYGVAGKGVKAPWYLGKRSEAFDDDDCEKLNVRGDHERVKKKSGENRKKSMEELREERMRRERKEKERERELVREFRRKEKTGYSNLRRRM